MTTGLQAQRRLAAVVCTAGLLLLAIIFAQSCRADEPYARSRNYALQDIRTHLWFDLDRRAIHGEVTESISALRDDVSELALDSVDLKIESVEVDGKAAKFSIDPKKLVVTLEWLRSIARQTAETATKSRFATKASRKKVFISSFPTGITRSSRAKFGRKVKRKTRAITSPCTITRTIARLRK
jgi:hypothetical protein